MVETVWCARAGPLIRGPRLASNPIAVATGLLYMHTAIAMESNTAAFAEAPSVLETKPEVARLLGS